MSHTPSAQSLAARADDFWQRIHRHHILADEGVHCDGPAIELLAAVTADLARRVAELEERLARHEAVNPALARRE